MKRRLIKFLRYLKKQIYANKYLFLILLIASFLHLVGLMPNVHHSDEGFVQDKTWELIKNFLTYGDLNPHTLKYGTLFFYMQAITNLPVLLAGYAFNWINAIFSSGFSSSGISYELFHDDAIRKLSDVLTFSGRFVVSIFGIGNIYLTYLIGKKLFNKSVGLISALFLTVAPLHVRDSHYITTDVPSLFFILLSFLFFTYLLEKVRLRWFILSGFFLGISATIRYFPIAFFIYPLVLIFSFHKPIKTWIFKVIVSLFSVFVGVFLGVPYLFLDPNGPQLFMQDLQKYALPWYGNSASSYIFSLLGYIFSQGKTTLPAITDLLPNFFRPFHASYVFFKGLGALPTLLGLAGIVLVFTKSFKKFILLMPIPLFTFIYASSYSPATYERIILPTIPFLAIFAGLTILSLSEYLKRVLPIRKSRVAISLVLATVIFQPLSVSTTAVIGCSQEWIQRQGSDWIKENIPNSAKIAFVPMVSFPPNKIFADYMGIEPNETLSMQEVANLGYDHTFINQARLDYVTYTFFNDFFVTPPVIFENSYYSLAFSEYMTRSDFLGKVEKPSMCETTRIYYFRLKKQEEAKKQKAVKVLGFDEGKELEFWEIQNFENKNLAQISYNSSQGNKKPGAMMYKQDAFTYVSPRLRTQKVLVVPGKSYTFSLSVKGIDYAKGDRVFLRMDFYSPKKTVGEKLVDKSKEVALLLSDGSTPIFFEKKRELTKFYDDPNLPGSVVALSPRVAIEENWTKITLTSEPSEDSEYVIFSIQSAKEKELEFLIDDVAVSVSVND